MASHIFVKTTSKRFKEVSLTIILGTEELDSIVASIRFWH
jgi:hypothetical protein